MEQKTQINAPKKTMNWRVNYIFCLLGKWTDTLSRYWKNRKSD